jgi:hypothetical protein
MLPTWTHKPTYEEYCEMLGYDPADHEFHRESWSEFCAEWVPEDHGIVEGTA